MITISTQMKASTAVAYLMKCFSIGNHIVCKTVLHVRFTDLICIFKESCKPIFMSLALMQGQKC